MEVKSRNRQKKKKVGGAKRSGKRKISSHRRVSNETFCKPLSTKC